MLLKLLRILRGQDYFYCCLKPASILWIWYGKSGNNITKHADNPSIVDSRLECMELSKSGQHWGSNISPLICCQHFLRISEKPHAGLNQDWYFTAVILNPFHLTAHWEGTKMVKAYHQIFLTVDKIHCTACVGLTSPMTLLINESSPKSHGLTVDQSPHSNF